MTRAFFAVFPPSQVRDILVGYVDSLRREYRAISWVKPGNMHLTLRFLGAVEDVQLESCARAAEAASLAHRPFELSLAGSGAFPSLHHPRVAWIGVEVGRGNLVGLAADLEQSLVYEGLGKAENPFTAHLTVGRVKGPIAPEALPALFKKLPPPPCSFTVERVELVRSFQRARETQYSVMRSFALRAP